MKKLGLFILMVAILFVSGCFESKITSFSFTKAANPELAADINGVINDEEGKISVSGSFPNGLKSLKATFKCSAKISVNNIIQKSGVTPNDFTIPINYKISSKRKAKEYTVIVEPIEPRISKFEFNKAYNTDLENDIVGLIDDEKGTILISGTFPKGFSNLIATVETDCDKVEIIDNQKVIPQKSDETVNDFSKPLKYQVTCGASQKEYIVTVSEAQQEWKTLGKAGFSSGEAKDITLKISQYDPYVAYSDSALGKKAVVKKFDKEKGLWINLGPDSGISEGEADYLSMDIFELEPYIAFADVKNGGKVMVMKFNKNLNKWETLSSALSSSIVSGISLSVNNGGIYIAYVESRDKVLCMKFDGKSWSKIGKDITTEGRVNSLSMAFFDDIPYIAYSVLQSGLLLESVTSAVKLSSGQWKKLGSEGFNDHYHGGDPRKHDGAENISLAISNVGIPFVAFIDIEYTNKAEVRKNTGSGWTYVNTGTVEEISSARAEYTSLFIYGGVPYVAYMDASKGEKATVKKYDAEQNKWVIVGKEGFTPDKALFNSLYVYKSVPYIAFSDGSDGKKATVMKLQ